MSRILPAFILNTGLFLAALPVLAQTATVSEKPAIMLDALLEGPNPWETTAEQFETGLRSARPQWLTTQKDQARFFGEYGLWGGAIPVKEAVVEFQAGKLFRVNISLFNRGDSASAFSSRAEFDKQLEAWKAAISTRTGVPPVDLGLAKCERGQSQRLFLDEGPLHLPPRIQCAKGYQGDRGAISP